MGPMFSNLQEFKASYTSARAHGHLVLYLFIGFIQCVRLHTQMLWSYLVPSAAVCSYLELSGVSWSYLALSEAVCIRLQLSGAIWSYLELSRAIWRYLALSLELSGYALMHTLLYYTLLHYIITILYNIILYLQSLWNLYHMLVCTHKYLAEAFWSYLGLSGAIWSYLNLSGATWTYL